MAKPVQLPAEAGPSSSSTTSNAPPSRPRRRCRRNKRHRTAVTPSSGILTLLAAVSASSATAYGRPLDAQHTTHTSLPFLYPFIDDPRPSHPHPSPVPGHPAYASDFPTPTVYRKLDSRSLVPDKYVQGADGLWRKSSSWSLYGSMLCSVPCADASESALPNDVNDQLKPDTNQTITPTEPATTSTLDTFDLDALPTGWKPASTEQRDLTRVILPLSLILALAIIGLMVACVFWRRKSKVFKDIEKRSRKKHRGDEDPSDDEDSESVRHAKAAQKKWTKAANRWRANIRHSVRRRRTNRVISNVSGSQSSGMPSETLREDPEEHTVSQRYSRASSPTPSRHSHRSAIIDASSSLAPPTPTRPPTPGPSTDVTDISTPAPADLDSPSHPPAYRPNSPGPPQTSINISRSRASPSYYGSSSAIPSSSKSPPPPPPPPTLPDADEAESGLAPSTRVAHVATDDKAVLARMVAMASAPPVAVAESSPHVSPSVPTLEDYENALLPDDLPPLSPPPGSSELRPSYSPPLSGLPLPPAKGKLAAPHYDDYPYSFEQDLDIAGVEPEPGPSAPPFEESPSEPPVPDIRPSAPPLDDDSEGTIETLNASAPPLWDGYPEDSYTEHGRSPASIPGSVISHSEVPCDPSEPPESDDGPATSLAHPP